MDTTQQLVVSILNSSYDAAYVAASSVLNLMNVNFDDNELRSRIKSKFDYVLDDTGVKANLLGKASTIDQALAGKMGSAVRNKNWMMDSRTVRSLDEDVNRLRMMLSAKGIDQKMRVLNNCFKVWREPGKSSSMIRCTKLFKDKLARGEVIEIVDVDDQMEVEVVDWKRKYDEIQSKFDKLQKSTLDNFNNWEKKYSELQSTVINLREQLADCHQKMFNLNTTIQSTKLNDMRNMEVAKDIIVSKIVNSKLDDDLKSQMMNQVLTFNLIDMNPFVNDLINMVTGLIDDNDTIFNMLTATLKKFGLSYSIE